MVGLFVRIGAVIINYMGYKMSNLLEPIVINRIMVGNYSITHQSDGNYWIGIRSGEGMQTTKAKLEKLIHNFYYDEF